MSYRTIKGLKRNAEFSAIVEKIYKSIALSHSTELTHEEESFVLTGALLLLRGYDVDRSYRSYAEFGYNIILQYSILTGNYEPLYDFSVNFGFYPIAELLVDQELIELNSVTDELAKLYINEEYRYKDNIETYDQKKMRATISTDSDINELCLVAPTSYGKSSLIIDDILATRHTLSKVVIIVPTKSLIAQTFNNIKNALKHEKIILHDEMYMNDVSFVGILTQERAIRLLIKHPELSFDKMYIDEAHNLFSSDHRVVMLARLIKMNRERNTDSKVTYLSPLINNSDNLRYSLDQDIVEQRIDFNMKEPLLYNIGLNGSVSLYNRFLDIFYDLEGMDGRNYLSYITENSSKKNFVYLYTPRSIEEFCIELIAILPTLDDPKIDEIIKNLEEHIHEDFFTIQCLKKGVIYLHGRLPDNVKEYLESKFAEVESIKYLVANKVVLEGINMPIETLFVLNTFRLHNKDLTNLVGRVNRLNHIFSITKNVNLLLPKVHFINTEKYHRAGSNMTHAIRELRTGLTEDEVENPLLYEFDILKYHPEREQKKIKNAERILNEEVVITSEPSDDIQKLKRDMIQLGLSNIYNLTDHLSETILNRFKNTATNNSDDILDIIYNIFVKDLSEHIKDKEFQRLDDVKTKNYYQKFITEYRSLPFKQSINRVVASFAARINNPTKSNVIYLGKNLGELTHPNGGFERLYVDLSTKSRPQLVNLSIAKLKLEGDFIHYKLAMIMQLLLDYNKISIESYNFVIHGTTDIDKLRLMRLGMSSGMIAKLEADEQLQNVSVNINNQIEVNQTFLSYVETLDDFGKFEILKVI